MENKKILYGISIAFGIILLFLLLNELMYISSHQTCAKITGKFSGKGSTYFTYEFKLDGKIYEGNISKADVQQEYEIVKKLDCIKVEYSNVWASVNKCVDTRLLKK